MTLLKYTIAITLFFILPGCRKNDPVKGNQKIQLSSVRVGPNGLNLSGSMTTDLPIDQPIVLSFSSALDIATVPSTIKISNAAQPVEVDFFYLDNNKTVSITPKQPLQNKTQYTLVITDQLKGANKEEFPGFQVDFKTIAATLSIVSYSIGGQAIANSNRTIDVPLDLSIEFNFSMPLNTQTITSSTVLVAGPVNALLTFGFSNQNKTLTITRATPLVYLSKYILSLSADIQGAQEEVFSGLSKEFYTAVGNHASGLPAKTDDELLTLVQQQTFKYFWDVAQTASGMARERDSSGDLVTTGGSGFGIMSIVVGMQRGFITRAEGLVRLKKIVGFLETADRFHGAWGHWINGNTGKIIPFSTNDNGGDLVETSFLMQGLITFRQYLVPSDTAGNNLINRITNLYNTVEWDWYRRCEPACQNVLYWHWSPDKNWIMNFALSGYFEEQITYFMAAGSPTHGIPKIVYSSGYGKNGAIVKNNMYYGYTLPLESPAPLFWVQYSYLGLDPHFSDDYANYWTQNVNATLINYSYCGANPQHYAGYSAGCWGLTASDNPNGYGAQSPGNDNGTITPTAALSSFPYSPTESMQALRFFYDTLGDRIWGPYGFYDAFNVTAGWYANSYLAIDQGPIVVMIENYRSGLLWNLFMSAPEVQQAKTTLSFH